MLRSFDPWALAQIAVVLEDGPQYLTVLTHDLGRTLREQICVELLPQGETIQTQKGIVHECSDRLAMHGTRGFPWGAMQIQVPSKSHPDHGLQKLKPRQGLVGHDCKVLTPVPVHNVRRDKDTITIAGLAVIAIHELVPPLATVAQHQVPEIQQIDASHVIRRAQGRKAFDPKCEQHLQVQGFQVFVDLSASVLGLQHLWQPPTSPINVKAIFNHSFFVTDIIFEQ
mmetsp:Transcript_128591/g.320701  ORF Transcript_128591/g.320701 Transcript_128591/m.320701 type:complete len:226 (-) Transcript_128591:710-1387(-)